MAILGKESTRGHGKLCAIILNGFVCVFLAIFLREAIQEDIEGHILAPDDDFMYKTKRRK